MLDTNYNNKRNKNKSRLVNLTTNLWRMMAVKVIELLPDDYDVIIYAWEHCRITINY